MRIVIVTSLRRVVTVAWLVAVLALIGLAAWSHLASLVVVAGSSMEPAVARGSVVRPASVDPGTIAAGDILTVGADNGVVITHRVVRAIDLPEGRFFELKGDANKRPDAELVPERAVIGRVDIQIPYAGYVLALLGLPSGFISVLAALGMMLVGIWLLEDVEARYTPKVRPRGGARAIRGTPA